MANTVNVENLGKIKRSIEAEPNDYHIMDVEQRCGSPGCVIGHCKVVMKAEGLLEKDFDNHHDLKLYEELAVMKYLDLNHNQFCQIYAPSYSFARYGASKKEQGYITKSHVIRMLDLLIAGEESVEEAWRKSKGGEAL